MRIDLPSGAWVDIRERLLADDKFAVQGSFTVTVLDGKQVLPSGIQNTMRNALLARIITAWSFEGIPIPSASPAGADLIGSVLDIDDYNSLQEQVDPLLEKVSFTPNR